MNTNNTIKLNLATISVKNQIKRPKASDKK